MPFHRFVAGLSRGVLAAAALLAAGAAAAAEGGFAAGLSPQERALAGLDHLNPAQLASLDALVERDVTLARQGGVTGFSSAFTERHAGAEADSAGLGRLSPQEAPFLNGLVARAIATVPLPGAGFTYAPHAAALAAPAPTLVSAPPKAEVHGDVSVSVGVGGHGSYFYGTSVDTFITDPSGRWTLGLGFGEYKGKGPIGPFGPCWVDPAYPLLLP